MCASHDVSNGGAVLILTEFPPLGCDCKSTAQIKKEQAPSDTENSYSFTLIYLYLCYKPSHVSHNVSLLAKIEQQNNPNTINFKQQEKERERKEKMGVGYSWHASVRVLYMCGCIPYVFSLYVCVGLLLCWRVCQNERLQPSIC